MEKMKIGIAGAGTMGTGIAQVVASAGHETLVYDISTEMLEKAKSNLASILEKLAGKGKISLEESKDIFSRIKFSTDITAFSSCQLVLEAAVEDETVKKKLFACLEQIVSSQCILATNTSSLSITSIAAVCQKKERVLGIHFFNPAPLMPLAEVIPGMETSPELPGKIKALLTAWGKAPVLAKDSPGFIVNRVARPFYGEAIRIYEERFADCVTIDWAMKEFGGFKMGPFELMDLIGNDVNYAVTETVWKQFHYDPKYKPSLTQKRMAEAGLLGRKTGKGYYDYSLPMPEPEKKDRQLGEYICWRIVVMLINEAADALYYGIASKEDIDLAMTKGVNYPKGLFKWADEKGIEFCLQTMEGLYAEYCEDRYRPSVLLKKMAREKRTFY